jgi:hypothetical protein
VANPSVTLFSTWTPAYGDPCDVVNSWNGVTCSSGSVVGLDLSYGGLVGSLPRTLSLVVNLTSVKLPGNSFTSSLPSSWSTLSRLTFLSIANSQLTGTLPTAWSTMGALTQLNLGSNFLIGTIPPTWPIGMVNLSRFVAITNPGLCGPFPGSWTNARVLNTGTSLGSTCAQTSGLLSLMSAILPATWPSGMTGWSNTSDPCGAQWTGVTCTGPTVTALDLGYYGLQGSLPPSLGLVSGLQTLTLGGNRYAFIFMIFIHVIDV